MVEIILAVAIAFFTWLALARLDDTNGQVFVPLVVVLGLLLAPTSLRWLVGIAALAGAVAYLVGFLLTRLRTAPMPQYPMATPRVEASSPGDRAAAAPQQASRRMPDGPYYIPGSPEVLDLAKPGTPGTPLTFAGRILRTSGEPVRGATVEVWHADGRGDYDNSGGFNCRGHQFTGQDGAFSFRTVKPFGYGKRSWSLAGVLDFRSAHFHVKIRAGDEEVTSQVWFPDDARNEGDLGYRGNRKNVVATETKGDTETARFDFVI